MQGNHLVELVPQTRKRAMELLRNKLYCATKLQIGSIKDIQASRTSSAWWNFNNSIYLTCNVFNVFYEYPLTPLKYVYGILFCYCIVIIWLLYLVLKVILLGIRPQSLFIGVCVSTAARGFDYCRFLSTGVNHNTHVPKVYRCQCWLYYMSSS